MNKFLLLILGLISWTSCSENSNNIQKKYSVIAYYFAKDTLNETDINVNRLTHLNYAFANIVNGKIKEGNKFDSLNFIKLNNLKNKNADFKILISVGGWGWSGEFSDMALNKSTRKVFINSCINFIKKHNLDGIDIDWEYPGLPGNNNTYRKEDKQNFTLLLKETRLSLDSLEKKRNKKLLLTIAAGAFEEYLKNIEPEKIIKYLDFINLMSYDFTGEWNDTAYHHANLFTSKKYPYLNSANKAVNLFINNGIPANKIVLGIAFYGRAWTQVGSNHNGLGQKANGKGFSVSFAEIKTRYLNKNNFIYHYDSEAQAPYLWSDRLKTFISFEDTSSVKAKCRYIKKNKLKGLMFWEYTNDYNETLLKSISF